LSLWLIQFKDFQVHLFIKALLEGEGDEFPEAAFYMMGTMEEALEEGRRLASLG
jgi:F0F1-type ATP synthase beta subunit